MSNAARQSSPGESFLGQVFDSYQNMMQIAACIREVGRQRAVANPRVLELSRRKTGLADYIPEARITHYPTHENNQPTLSAPVALPFADRSFDCCVITDVYEHIPSERRPELLGEMLRVTDGLMLVAAPQRNEIVTRFDRIVFDFIWGKYAERFEPLEQHAHYGLEPVRQTLDSLRAQGADHVIVLPGNYVYRWIHLILIYFDWQHRNPQADLFEPFNRIYNAHLSPYDYREPCYRYLIAIATHKGLSIDTLRDAMTTPYEKPELAGETNRMLVEVFREIDAAAADQLRERAKDIAYLKQVNEHLAQDNEQKAQEIARLNADLWQSRRGLFKRAKSRIRRLIKKNLRTDYDSV